MKQPLVIGLLFLTLPVFAQFNNYGRQYMEVGFLFGLTNYSGDLSQKPVELNETHPGYGAFVRYNFTNHFSGKAHIYSGTISGDDANTSYTERSFRFSTAIFEFATVAEWNILGRDRFSGMGKGNFFITPYLFGGLGLTLTSNYAEYYGSPDKRADYLKVPFPEPGLKHRFLLAPVGGGLRADIFDFIIVGVEAGLRPVFSDDLDGIRVNGNPNSGDWYYFGGATVSFVINRAKRR